MARLHLEHEKLKMEQEIELKGIDSQELSFLKPKTFKNLDEMAKEADLFAEARGGVHTRTNKGQRDNRGAAQNHSKPDVNKGGGKQEISYKNPNRMQASSAEVGNEAKGGDSDAKIEMQGA